MGFKNTIFGRLKSQPFKALFDTSIIASGSSANNQLSITINSLLGNYLIIFWGDGSSSLITTESSPLLTHTYSSVGQYIVSMQSDNFRPVFGNKDRSKILKVMDWGNCNFFVSIFSGCSNLTLDDIIIGKPKLLDYNAIKTAFTYCNSLVTIYGVSTWDFTTIPGGSCDGFISYCPKFNQSLNLVFGISGGNLNNLLSNNPKLNSDITITMVRADISSIIENNSAFNSQLKVVGVISNATAFVRGCNVLNTEIILLGGFAVGANMNNALQGTTYNKPMNWDISNVISYDAFMLGNGTFNQPLTTWVFNKNAFLTYFMSGNSFSVANYNDLLARLRLAVVGTGRTQTNKTLKVQGAKYSIAGKPDHDALVADGWTLQDSGMV
jgi:hypothetical protein